LAPDMQVLPASPRKRRRLAKIGLVVLAVLVVGLLTAIFKRPSNDAPSSAPSRGSVYVEDKPVRLTPEMRREINATLNRFVPAAVLRRDTSTAYELSTPALRAGASRKEWESGEIPVFPAYVRPPYTGWNLNYSIKDNVNFDLMLRTTKREKEVSAYSYNVDLKRVDGAWRVEMFYPVAQFRRTSLENGTKVVASYDFVPLQYDGAGRSGREEEKRIFTLAIFSIPALGLTLVLLLFGAQYVRNRRAERSYSDHRATS
jgi:hypothetical protein